ncbi:MAG: FKBP-type peptidyl-prolyl cis-trans isomerase [Schleiferiaceae bacterium]
MVVRATIVFVAALLTSCVQPAEVQEERPVMDPMERNRMYLAQERQLIDQYIESHQLEGIEPNGYGMFELPVVDGEGATAEIGDRIVYEATVYLLDDSGVGRYRDTIELGYSQVEVGLHEALEGMKEGDVKLVLIPSFLAHGIAGDLDKVPPQSPLRYDLRLIQVSR